MNNAAIINHAAIPVLDAPLCCAKVRRPFIPPSTMSALYDLTRIDPVTGLSEPIPAARRIQALLELPGSRRVVRSMDPQTIYSLVSSAGLHDAFDLVLMLSGEQCQALVDFDCWTRDDIETERLENWLDVLLQREDADLAEMLSVMDMEPLVVWLREKCQIFIWEEDRDLLDTIDDPVLTSPDGQYAIVIPEGDEQFAGRLRLFLDRVYALDLVEAHRYLEAARWELTTDMTERAYASRNARLGDLGFVPVHEAMEVYAVIDPTAWAARTRSHALREDSPVITLSVAGSLGPVDEHLQILEARAHEKKPPFFSLAMAALPQAFDNTQLPGIADSIMAQFRAVANRVHIADLGQPGDLPAARQALKRTIDTLSLGLELAAGSDVVIAARVLAKTPLREIHQAGYSATARLAHTARRLRDRGNLTLLKEVRESLLKDTDRVLFDSLFQRRPLLNVSTGRRFARLADVERVAVRLGDIAFLELLIFGWFRMTHPELVATTLDPTRVESPADSITFRSLLATLTVRALTNQPIELAPISLQLVHQAQDRLRQDPDLFADTLQTIIAERRKADGTTAALEQRLVAEVSAWWNDEVGPTTAPLPAELAAEMVLLGRS